MGRVSVVKKDVDFYVLNSNEYYDDCKHTTIFEPSEFDKMLKYIGITYKSLLEYMSKKIKLTNGMELYKNTKSEDKLERLI